VTEQDSCYPDMEECNISVDHLYKWALIEVELWVLMMIMSLFVRRNKNQPKAIYPKELYFPPYEAL
jgi:hypothetical protein